MTRKILFSSALIILFTLLGVFSCTKDKTPRPAVTTTIPCDPNKVYFEKSVRPIINSNCAMSGCHDAATHQDGVNLSTYEGIRAQVSPGRPGDSEIMQVITETDEDKRMPPWPKDPLTQQQTDLIRKWIEQGADNAVCDEGGGPANCSPANVSFANEIQPILNTNCIGCHSGSTLSGGVNLSTHAGVQAVAQTGKLYNAVSQNGQATPMPPNGKLAACDIQKIKVWVDEGFKNN
jgi:uncharacterized membrane protein